MVVSVTGATGFIDNHCVRDLTRSKSNAQLIFPVKDFPGIIISEEPEWKDCIQSSNAVVNLAGLPISSRWSSEVKKEIKESRIRVPSKVVDLINSSKDDVRPTVLVSATAVGYYGSSETQVFDERSPSGNDYLAEVCREWEGTALKVNNDVRVALIRIGVVLGKDGGALAKMIPLFMMFAGGPLGSGKQWFSWIHLDDIVNLIYEALSNPSYRGVINGSMELPQTLFDWQRCVNSWEMSCAGPLGCLYLTLHSKQCSEKVLVWFWKGKGGGSCQSKRIGFPIQVPICERST